MNKLPIARSENIVLQNVGSELLVYDLLTNKAYNLNETSAIVFNACGGDLSFDELKSRYKFSDDLIYLSLDELSKNNLLQTEYVSQLKGIDRREVIKRVGLASMVALPAISSLVAPRALQAASSTSTCPGGNCSCNCNSTPENCNSVVGIPCGTDPNGYVTLAIPCTDSRCQCVAAPFGQADNCVA